MMREPREVSLSGGLTQKPSADVSLIDARMVDARLWEPVDDSPPEIDVRYSTGLDTGVG
jgi:hypothetical protein